MKNIKIDVNDVLKEILKMKVAILDGATDVIIDETTVQEIVEGFDLYLACRGKRVFLKDFQDEEYEWLLGETLEDILNELSTFDEYFYSEEWYSDFTYFI